MKALLMKLSAMDSDAEAALRVIAYFDALTLRSATPEMIVRGTAALAETAAGLRTEDGVEHRFAPDGRRLSSSSDGRRRREQRAGSTTVWLEREDAPAAMDDLILERFALAVRAVGSDRRERTDTVDTALVETALSHREPLEERSLALRRLGLSASAQACVVAIAPAGSVESAGEVGSGILGMLRRSHSARGAMLGGMSAAIVPLAATDPGAAREDFLTSLRSSLAAAPAPVRVGVGGAIGAFDAHRSWAQARLALRFSSPNRLDAAVIDAEQLGALSALSTVDAAVWQRDPRVCALRDFSTTENGRIDLAVLEMYLAHGSLRLAGSALHMHHSSVASRLARVEERLGLDLTNPQDVFDARLGLIALTLLETAGDQAEAPAAAAGDPV
ncbi:PucR-like helix-turn-helix protein [Microbacterium sp. SLBN-154]|nr:PucR-like helix-turn-helix protein [Microbacterium sp. SLBN-154]